MNLGYVEDMGDEELVSEHARLERILREAPMALTCGEADSMADRQEDIRREQAARHARALATSTVGTGTGIPSPDPADRDLSGAPRRSVPPCPHCRSRFGTWDRLSAHLRFECKVLGRDRR